MLPSAETSHAAAALSSRQRTILSQILQDLRQTLSHMRLPKVTPLSALDATAIDALKDLYYLANTEDPLNTMPIRRHILSINITSTLLLPLLSLLHSDPAAKTNPKRWSVPIYHSLRLFSVLASPILRENGLLPPASSLDEALQDLRVRLADSAIIDAYVALLQYYLDRKARKAAALAAAEESKLEDARIDNILRFFRNLLSPPRASAGEHLQIADKGVHYAVVRSLVNADFYSTLSILFASQEDARGQYTDLVFLVSEIYGLTFRHSTPKQVYQAYRRSISEKTRIQSGDTLSVQQDIRKRRSAGLRTALRRERAVIGGSRAIRASARWTSRHSGGFTVAPNKGDIKTSRKKIISARSAVQSNLTFNPKRPLQEAIRVNSDIFCLLAAKGRSKSGIVHKKVAAPIKQDVVEEGLRGIVALTTEFVEVCFEYFVRELRERIEQTKQKSKADETETLMTAQKSFVAIVGAVVGFHRERFGKIYRDKADNPPSLNAQLHDNCMKAVLSSDFKIVQSEWKAVEAGIELETFQLVFRVLVESCEALREGGKDDEKVQIVELSTSAVLEMMKMLQGMTANSNNNDNEGQGHYDTDKKPVLTPREIALNTLEQLFERQSFLNAPAELAKDFSTKMFSFRHLTNIVEVAHAFTTILLDEQELARLQVTKKKRNKTKKQQNKQEKNEESDPEFQIAQEDAQKNKNEDQEESEQKQDNQEPRVKKKKKIVESDDEEQKEGTATGDPPASEKVPDMPSTEDQSVPSKEPDETIPVDAGGKSVSDSESNERVEGTQSLKQDTVQKQLHIDTRDDMENPQNGNASSIDKPSKELSKAQQLLLADAERESQTPSTNLRGSQQKGGNDKDQSQTQSLSKVQLMLIADKEREPEKPETTEKPNSDKLTIVRSMLLADANQDEKETEMPRLVSTIAEMRREANKEKAKAERATENGINAKADEGDASSDDSEEEPELREIESIGIIRRFAHAKALQTLVLPVRAALCEASLSGVCHPIPEGSSTLLSPIVIAKSAHVLAAIWRVAKIRERGVQCGQFFSYSTMHLMSVVLCTTKQCVVRKDSVLERFSVFAKDVTKEFFSWLAINPGLVLDMFFPMDKSSCSMYVSYMRQKVLADSRQAIDEDSGNDSDMSLLEIERRVDNAAANGAEKPRGSNGSRYIRSKAGKRRMRERRRAEREKIEEDEDVDDIDNLDIGIDEGEKSVEDSPAPPPSRKAKRTRMQSFDPFDSDEEYVQSRMRKLRVATAKKVAKKVKESATKKVRDSKPTFSSSDEYSDMIDSDMELSDSGNNGGSAADKDVADPTSKVGHTGKPAPAKEATVSAIPVPTTEKSKSRIGHDRPEKQHDDEIEENPSQIDSEPVAKRPRSERKRCVIVSDDDSE